MSFQSASAISGHDMVYDANGNLIQGDGFYYEYNSVNQLKRARLDNSSGFILADFWYASSGERIKKVEYGVDWNRTTYYIGNHFESEFFRNASGTFTTNRTHHYVNGEKVATDVDDGTTVNTYYYHTDHLGSTSIITDENGSLVERTKYYPYGSIREGGEADKYYYTGKELDKDTELYFYGARYYKSEFATFTQPDTVIPDVYDPQSLNRYAYVENNPLKYVDPTGHAPRDAQEIGNADEVSDFFYQILENSGDLDSSNTEQLEALTYYYQNEYQIEEGNYRYVNTDEGLIDFLHYFTSAETTLEKGSAFSFIGGAAYELLQRAKGDPSGTSNEDMPSNRRGRDLVGFNLVPTKGDKDRFDSQGNLLENIEDSIIELNPRDKSEYEGPFHPDRESSISS
jgi:RHS repeat-associated protein